MRIGDALVAATWVGCAAAEPRAAPIDASVEAAPSCAALGFSCADAGCPPGTGVYAVEGRPACPSGGCCEPCPAPNVLSGALCITAGQAQCDQRGGVCSVGGVCPDGYLPAGGTCGDGLRVPFSPCCLPRKDGG